MSTDASQLLRDWQQAKKRGLTRQEYAVSVGISEKILDNLLYRAKRARTGEQPHTADAPEAEGVTVVGRGNYLEVESNSRRIKNLDDLIRECRIDLTDWIIERHIVNKWEVGAKTAARDFQVVDGRLTGTLKDNGQLTIEPLFQVKAWMVRRHPEAVAPVVRPVTIRAEAPRVAKPKPDGDLRRALVLSDLQFGFRRDLRTGALDPFHDRRALDVALQLAALDCWDVVVYLGDNLDLPDWSDKFLRSPEMFWSTQPAVVELAWWLAQFRRAAGRATHHMLEGNHDLRMETALIAHLQAGYALRPATELHLPPAMSVPRLLGLHELGIEWVGGYPDGEVWLSDDLVCRHGDVVRGGSGETAKAVRNADVSEIFGHIHRTEFATRTVHERNRQRTVTAFSPGCLCRVDGVVPAQSKQQNWQQGIAAVEYDAANFAITPVPIHAGRALYQGRAYAARDRLTDLRRDTETGDTRWGF